MSFKVGFFAPSLLRRVDIKCSNFVLLKQNFNREYHVTKTPFSRCYNNHNDSSKPTPILPFGCNGTYARTLSASLHTTELKPFKEVKKGIVKNSNPLFKLYDKRLELEERIASFFQRNSAKAWVDKAPDSIRPYLQLARVDKPIGTLLLYYPCVFSICLATQPGCWPSLYYLGLFGVGAFLMRGAGCIINDLWDRDLDKMVERTKDRPIASGQVSVPNAVKLLACKLTLSLGILLSLNPTCIAIGVASMIPVALYPLAKRYTSFPQLVLGLTFNIGALMGYTAVAGQPNWPVVASLYMSCILWTLYYDTIYAFQDALDDEKAGIKSIALLFNKYKPEQLDEMAIYDRMLAEKRKKAAIVVFLITVGGAHLITFAVTGFIKYLQGPFYLAIMFCVVKLIDQSISLEYYSRQSCWKSFNDTKWTGLILALGIILGVYSQGKGYLDAPRDADTRVESSSNVY